MFGVLNINKPAGLTSRDAVNRVQRIVRPSKAGHAGTLDPLATGVLVVCVGQATRLIEYVQRMRKRYVGTFLLGRHSDTEDIEGAVIEIASPPIPTLAQIAAALPKFQGEISQRPPMFSALKVGGQRAYALARRGRKVELTARTVTVYDLRVNRFEYPELELAIECGSGTYVRSLGRDLAESLGTAAVMSALQRTAIGPFDIATAIDLEELNGDTLAARLLPADQAVAELPRVVLSSTEAARVRQGLAIDRPDLPPSTRGDTEFAGLDCNEQLVAILSANDTLLRPTRCFG